MNTEKAYEFTSPENRNEILDKIQQGGYIITADYKIKVTKGLAARLLPGHPFTEPFTVANVAGDAVFHINPMLAHHKAIHADLASYYSTEQT